MSLIFPPQRGFEGISRRAQSVFLITAHIVFGSRVSYFAD